MRSIHFIHFIAMTLVALILLPGTRSFAKNGRKKDRDEAYRIVLTLKDGSLVNGYIRTSLMDGKSSVGVSETPKGSFKEYQAADVQSLVYPATQEDPDEVVYVPEKALKNTPNLLNKKGKEFKKPVFLRLIFEGKTITGYILPVVLSTTNATTTTYYNSAQYYYKVKGEEIARPYWLDQKGITIGGKKALKFYFKGHPAVVDYFDSEEFDYKEFNQHPETLLPVLDERLTDGGHE